MNKCKITVLKKTFQPDLAEEYGARGLGPCPMLREGQEFLADYSCPAGFCAEAWKAVYQYVFALAHGMGQNGELFYYGDWIRKPGVAICSCNDGLRPVLFKIERTELKSDLDYTPVPYRHSDRARTPFAIRAMFGVMETGPIPEVDRIFGRRFSPRGKTRPFPKRSGMNEPTLYPTELPSGEAVSQAIRV